MTRKLNLHHVTHVESPQFHGSHAGHINFRHRYSLGHTHTTITRKGQSFSVGGGHGLPSQSYGRSQVRTNFSEGAGYYFRKVTKR